MLLRFLPHALTHPYRDVFDKVARALNLPASPTRNMGAVLEEYAARSGVAPYDPSPNSNPNSDSDFDFDSLPRLPIAFRYHKENESPRLAFSFSGLLSATERVIAQQHERERKRERERDRETDTDTLSEAAQCEISRRFQQAAMGHLVLQVERALGLPFVRESVQGGAGEAGGEGGQGGESGESGEDTVTLGQAVRGLVVSGGVAANGYLRQR